MNAQAELAMISPCPDTGPTWPDGRFSCHPLAGGYVGRIDTDTAPAAVLEPPAPDQGARRVWADSAGPIWVSEWNAGPLKRYDPDADAWRTWELPGQRPRTYVVYVHHRDDFWVSDFGANAVLRVDPVAKTFESWPSPEPGAAVRQILGREGEVWPPESRTDTLVRFRLP